MKLNIKILSKPYAVSLVAALVTFIVYLPSLRNDFVTLDDHQYIYSNEHIKSLNLELVKWSFSDVHTGNWHPLAWISHALDFTVWGMNPAGHHLTNILLHALNSFLVTLLAVRLIETYRSRRALGEYTMSMSNKSVLLAGIVTGVLFGLHPIHVESVAWISERKDVLCSFFFLIALLEYIRYVSEQKTSSLSSGVNDRIQGKFIGVYLLFLLAVISKPMAITFPIILLILDWFPLQRLQTTIRRRQVVLEKTPFFITSIIISFIALYAQKMAHAMAERDPIPLTARIMNAAKALIAYLKNMVWPVDLMPLYPHPYWENPVLTSPQYMMPALTVAIVSVCCVLLIKRQKLWLAVWASYLVLLLPVLGIIQIGAQGMADRYTYLPSVGPFLIMGIVAGRVGEKILASDARKTACAVLMTALFILVVFLSNATIKQIHIWKDGDTLWGYELDILKKKYPKSSFVIWTANVGRGYAHLRNGNYEGAIKSFSEAILMQTDKDIVYDQYQQRAIAYARLGRLDEAIQDLTVAISLKPTMAVLYYNRGTAYAKRGSFPEAVADLTMAISMSTEPNADYIMNRGNSLKKLGRLEEGERDMADAKKIRMRSSRMVRDASD